MKTAFGYVRVSTNDQKLIDEQQKQLADFASANDFTFENVFFDIGSTADALPSLRGVTRWRQSRD